MGFNSGFKGLRSSICKFSALPCYLFPLWPKYSPQHHNLKTLSLRSSISVSYQVSHPYKITGKIFLYILVFIFLDSKLEGRIFCTEWQQAFPDFKRVGYRFLSDSCRGSFRNVTINQNERIGNICSILNVYICHVSQCSQQHCEVKLQFTLLSILHRDLCLIRNSVSEHFQV